MTKLKIIFINVNSIVSRHKRHYLNIFLNEHNPDILLLAEHKLTNRHTFQLKNYTIFRQDRESGRGRGGGTAILIKNWIKAERIEANLGELEGTIIEVKGRPTNLIIMSLYRKPLGNIEECDLVNIGNIIGNKEAIIGADLNAKHPLWGGREVNVSGRVLADWLNTTPNLLIRPSNNPTRSQFNYHSYIDIFITSTNMAISAPDPMKCVETLDYNSDHKAILINIKTITIV